MTTTNYAIRHVTTFTYDSAVSESVMELRMRPAFSRSQRCLQFEVDVQPRARVFAYTDCLGNWVHHFDIPRRHGQLTITARSQVQLDDPSPTLAAEPLAWEAIDQWTASGEHWDFRQASRFASWSPALVEFAESLSLRARKADPLGTVRQVMASIHGGFTYTPNSTQVDSPIDEALAARRGVCQDFSHIMLAALRYAGIPSRYVSGYIAPRMTEDEPFAAAIATHAWVEVLLPNAGWIGFDPTHNIETGIRHVRVAIGRDYADVPPTRGTFKGKAASSLAVSVDVSRGDTLPTIDRAVFETAWGAAALAAPDEGDARRLQQQQQQQ
jgi:transglutaminase-like putative cysteine protease